MKASKCRIINITWVNHTVMWLYSSAVVMAVISQPLCLSPSEMNTAKPNRALSYVIPPGLLSQVVTKLLSVKPAYFIVSCVALFDSDMS